MDDLCVISFLILLFKAVLLIQSIPLLPPISRDVTIEGVVKTVPVLEIASVELAAVSSLTRLLTSSLRY